MSASLTRGDQRPRRSCLVVPGHKLGMHEKAVVSIADEIVFDLEDAVPDRDKDEARALVVAQLADDRWRQRAVAVRVNVSGTAAQDADLEALAGCDHPALSIVVPKVETRADVQSVASRIGRDRPLQGLIESALGLLNVREVAADAVVTSLIVGYADLSASLGRRPGPGDAVSWVVEQEAVIIAARAAGVEVIDGPYFRLRDQRGLANAAVAARAAGFDGKWAIHPDQLSTINEAFAVSAEELAWAHEVLHALTAEGAAAVKEAMVDEAMARRARRTVRLSSHIATEAETVMSDTTAQPHRHHVSAPYFDELRPGQVFRSPGVTITPGHTAMHQAIIGDRLRLTLDEPLAEAVTGRPGLLAHPILVCNLAIGQSTLPSGRVLGNLFYRGLGGHPLHVGATLRTQTQVVARRDASGGRGIAALRVTSCDEHGATVLDFWRCPLLPNRPGTASLGAADDLEAVGRAAEPLQYVPRGWKLAPLRYRPLGPLFSELEPGQEFLVDAAETITAAPELARLTLNQAMTHTDASAGVYGERLVYGGHVIGIAAAHLTRALPDLATVLVWHSCDHLGPAFEGDILQSRIEITGTHELDDGGLVELRIGTSARALGGISREVLDWHLVGLMP